MKKNRHLIIVLTTIMAVIIVTMSCRKEKQMIKTTISLIDLQKAQLDTFNDYNSTVLDIIEKYPSQKVSNSIEKYANVYICCKSSNNDTVYVFEECHKVNLLMRDDTISCMGMIDKYNMTDFKSGKVMVFVPVNFKVNYKIKYFSAKLEIWSEY